MMTKYKPALLLLCVSAVLSAAVRDDFSKSGSWELMKNTPGELSFAPGGMTLSDAPGKPDWATAVRTFEVDLDRDFVLNLSVGSISGSGEVKVIRSKEKHSILRFRTPGIYSFDLREKLGWKGKSRIIVCLYV